MISVSIIKKTALCRIFCLLSILSVTYILVIILGQHRIVILPSEQSTADDANVQAETLSKDYRPRLDQPTSSSVLRGILIYYPYYQESMFLPELLWFYRSWTEMMKYEPPLWRTDIIIYSANFTSNLQQLGCVFNRTRVDRHESPQCRVFSYRPLFARDTANTDFSSYEPCQQVSSERSAKLVTYLREYEYIDSINTIAECYSSFSQYDYVLRTDSDVFLTQNFGHFVPYGDMLLTGRGGYSTAFNRARLSRIAKNNHWAYVNLTNIGSTWYGPPHVAQRLANFSLDTMAYLSMNEFTEPERKRKMGTLLWPDWYFGVLLLYGCELAFNHLIATENLNIGLAYEFLDQSSTSKDPYDIERNNRLHIHCWHTMDDFSKFRFKAGEYNRLHPRLYLNDTSPAGFAMRMALESRLMSFVGLKQSLMNAKNFSSY